MHEQSDNLIKNIRGKYHIVHLTSVHPVSDNRIFHKECRALAEAGYKVSLIAPHIASEIKNGVSIKALPRSPNRLMRMTLTAWKVWRQALKCDAGLYIFHDPELLPVGLLLRIGGRAAIYDAHEQVASTLLSKAYLPRPIRRFLAWWVTLIESLVSRRLTAVITITLIAGKQFQAINPRTIIIQNLPKISELAPPSNMAWEQRELAVAYVGAISLTRGLLEMVRALNLLPAARQITLKLAGRYAASNTRALAEALPGWERVEELGLLDRPEVASLLGRVRAGLVIIHPTPNYVVAQATKLFEYMSAGIPVIASDFPLWREFVEKHRCGLLVDPLDPPAIAAAICYIFDHPEEAEAMGKRGRAAIEGGLNWEAEAAKLVAFCDRLFGVEQTDIINN